jgi:hypothetical protein
VTICLAWLAQPFQWKIDSKLSNNDRDMQQYRLPIFGDAALASIASSAIISRSMSISDDLIEDLTNIVKIRYIS